MKVVGLHLENFKRIKAVDITPKENVVVISGANEQGKSSIIDGIWWILDSASMEKSTGTVKPVRDGEKRAIGTLDLGDIVATRKTTANGDSITVTNKGDVVPLKSPQKMMDALIGKLSFDPLSFSLMDEKEQVLVLRQLLGLDFTEIDQLRKEAYDCRTEIGRSIKSQQGALDELPTPASDTPDDEISLAGIMEELNKAQEVIRANDALRANEIKLKSGLEQVLADKKRIEKEIDELQIKIGNMRSIVIDCDMRIKKGEAICANESAKVSALVDPDLSVFKTKQQEAETVNKAVRSKKRFVEISTGISTLKKQAQENTNMIDMLDGKKAGQIKSSKMPIEHLGFDETGVTYKDIPFSQCSSAERLRVSLSIAMAMNPNLRVLRITDGSLLDSKNMEIIREMCKANDFQAWIEKVDESGKIGIVIEDGEIKQQ